MSRFLYILLLMPLAACNGLDDDTEFYPVTHAVYFHCADTTGSGSSIVRMDSATLIANWNNSFGISNANLSDVKGRGTSLWISSASENKILRINLEDESIEETYDGLSLAPHYICPGEKYCFICDTVQNKVGFLKIKNGELLEVNVDADPRQVIYNNEKFYVEIKGSLTLFSETALTSYYSTPVPGDIVDLHLDAGKAVQAHSAADSLFYNFTIDSNGDILVAGPYVVSWSRAHYSPWIYQQYGTEYLQNIYLTNQLLSLPGFADSTDAFEVDFFESKLYHTWNDSLTVTSLDNLQSERQVYFPWTPRSAFFYIDSQY
jgi:hypothetical protein